MANRCTAVLALLIGWALGAVAAADNAPDIVSLAGSVRAEVPKIGEEFGWTGDIPVVTSDAFDATPTSIALNQPEASQLLQFLPKDSWSDALRFLVAHEVWHFVQFKTASVDARSAPLEDRRLFECEADAAAGYYLVAHLDLQHIDYNHLAGSIADLASRLGLTQMNVADHPSDQQRHAAAQLGMTAGLRAAFAKLPQAAATQAVVSKSDSVTGFQNTDTLSTWVPRICREIMHYHVDAVAQVGVERASINFNKDPRTPFVTFAIPFINQGHRAVRVSVSVQSVAVPRHGAVTWTVVGRTDALNRTFELQPGHDFTVRGVLRWYADDKLMPLLLYDEQDLVSLISAEFISTQVISPEPAAAAPQLDPDEIQLALALQQLANDAANRFANSRILPGLILHRTETFQCSVPIPGTSNTEVRWGSDGSASVKATLYGGDSDDDARSAYADFLAKLRRVWPKRAIVETTSSDRRTQTSTMRLSRTAILTVQHDEDFQQTTLKIEPQFFETDE